MLNLGIKKEVQIEFIILAVGNWDHSTDGLFHIQRRLGRHLFSRLGFHPCINILHGAADQLMCDIREEVEMS